MNRNWALYCKAPGRPVLAAGIDGQVLPWPRRATGTAHAVGLHVLGGIVVSDLAGLVGSRPVVQVMCRCTAFRARTIRRKEENRAVGAVVSKPVVRATSHDELAIRALPWCCIDLRRSLRNRSGRSACAESPLILPSAWPARSQLAVPFFCRLTVFGIVVGARHCRMPLDTVSLSGS